VRWKYGLPPAGNANYAWIQHMIHHLAPNGKIGLVLANGALSTQSSGEGEIRKRIIEDDLIEGIIAMPTQLFYSVTIPVTLWFITKGKKQKGRTISSLLRGIFAFFISSRFIFFFSSMSYPRRIEKLFLS
jgi:type I restriction enzyme M protein